MLANFIRNLFFFYSLKIKISKKFLIFTLKEKFLKLFYFYLKQKSLKIVLHIYPEKVL